MNPSDYEITDLIPQRVPMIMIDTLEYAGEKSAGGSFLIQESNVFCHGGIFMEAGMLEFIAQTAAAYTGYRMVQAGGEVKPGFIGSVKNVVVHSLPQSDTIIKSEITIDSELLGYTIISGKVFQGPEMLAECEMRIKTGN
ncbi:MAG TPA: beta-hydroxyacyl-ACP dehydratase [Bacteroidales bacterium]|nr:beta-hydroxyacyl-ACP dehydratase [Bacteroidales bacterium]HPJ58361.1 beta-hydroxyacyl-ACP dehydratase [Bacteroidales bacterium]HRW84207.1 beta-hydroxyacyl-ACP dehydratase [Bacteroidales bacterium]